eukprot:4411108-Prymnesium_polylepis.1
MDRHAADSFCCARPSRHAETHAAAGPDHSTSRAPGRCDTHDHNASMHTLHTSHGHARALGLYAGIGPI